MTTVVQSPSNVKYAKTTSVVFAILIAILAVAIMGGWLAERFVLVAIAATLFGAWLILIAYYLDIPDRWRFVRWIPLKEFGEAIAISAFLALSLDYYLRSRTIQTVVESAAAQYMVYELPRQVANEVNYVRRLELLRKSYHVKYTFEPIDGDPQHLTLRKDWSFSIVNYSGDPLTYTHRVVLDRDPDSPETSEIQLVSATGSDLDKQYELANPGHRFERQVSIRPNSGSPDNTFEAKTTRVVRIRDQITDFLVDVPTLNAIVEIDKPPTLDVAVSFGDHKTATYRPTNTRFQTWSLQGASLPGLAIEVRWLPARSAKEPAARMRRAK